MGLPTVLLDRLQGEIWGKGLPSMFGYCAHVVLFPEAIGGLEKVLIEADLVCALDALTCAVPWNEPLQIFTLPEPPVHFRV